MSIIDATYFTKGHTFIPHSEDINPDTSSTKENTELKYFIEKYERELLINALGVTLYNELENAATPLSGKWQKLVEGETYTVDGKEYRWEGLKGFNNSLIANYVYCMWLRHDESHYTTTGVIANKAKNAKDFDPTPKYIKVWNLFIEAYQGQQSTLPQIIHNHYGDVGLDYYGQQKNVIRSLYQYITDKNNEDETNFPDAPFKFYEYQNSFGI